jgi:hypothetical protein
VGRDGEKRSGLREELGWSWTRTLVCCGGRGRERPRVRFKGFSFFKHFLLLKKKNLLYKLIFKPLK